MRLFIATIVVVIGSSPAFAHRLNVVPKIIGDQLRIEAFYSDDTPAQEAHITISIGDEVLIQGLTDEKGVWVGARPKPGKYTVKAESIGHAAKETLVIDATEKPPGDAAPDVRKERTQMPWGRLAAGLGMIGGLYVAWLIARRAIGRGGSDLTS